MKRNKACSLRTKCLKKERRCSEFDLLVLSRLQGDEEMEVLRWARTTLEHHFKAPERLSLKLECKLDCLAWFMCLTELLQYNTNISISQKSTVSVGCTPDNVPDVERLQTFENVGKELVRVAQIQQCVSPQVLADSEEPSQSLKIITAIYSITRSNWLSGLVKRVTVGLI